MQIAEAFNEALKKGDIKGTIVLSRGMKNI
jgi:hypothetical protein